MSKKKLINFSKEELEAQLAKTKMLSSIFLGLVIAMILLSLYSIYSNDVNFSTFLPLFFLPMLFTQYNQIKAIKKEIESRK